MKLIKEYQSNHKSINREFLLITVFLLSLMISTISNYNLVYLSVKVITSIFLTTILFFDYRKSRNEFDFRDQHFKKFIIILSTLIILPAFTLIYSFNQKFGFEKLLYLIFSTIPVIIFFYYLIISWNPLRLKIFLFIIISIGFIGAITTFILKPFEYELYKFDIFNWSHVIFGRFISSIALIEFFLLLKSSDKKKIYLFAIISFVLFITTYFTALRASVLGLLFFSLFYLLYTIFKIKGKSLNKIISASVLLISTICLLTFFFQNIQIQQRFNALKSIPGIQNDPAINARIIAYNLSFEKFKESPIIGLGFGGFKSQNNNDISSWMNYPHNILIEILVEFGVVGFFLFSFLIYLLLKHTRKFSFEVFIFFLFMLWLALFSKDLPTNSMFLIGIAFIGLPFDHTF